MEKVIIERYQIIVKKRSKQRDTNDNYVKKLMSLLFEKTAYKFN